MANQETPRNELASGELKGWEISLKIVTDGCGRVAVVYGDNEDMVLVGPTTYMPDIANWINEYLQED